MMHRPSGQKKQSRAARSRAARFIALLALLVLFLSSGCRRTIRSECSFFAMDTYMTLTAYGAGEDVLQGAEEKIREIEERLSVTKDSSELSRLNREESAEVSEDTMRLLSSTIKYAETTEGALDPSIYPVTKLWGFTTGEYRVPSDEEISEALKRVGWFRIGLESREEGRGFVSLPEGFMIDLGAVAKGYAGEELKAYFHERGVESALLDLGGNIQTVGMKPDGSPFRIAVKDPQGSSYLGVLSLDLPDLAVVTSGAYERYFEESGKRYGHIMDPMTGRPAESGLLSVTIVHVDGVLCDAFSTACFVMGEERSIDFWRSFNSFEFIMVTEDGRLLVSEGEAERFVKDGNCPYKLEIIRR